jgi:hypothetical protein
MMHPLLLSGLAMAGTTLITNCYMTFVFWLVKVVRLFCSLLKLKGYVIYMLNTVCFRVPSVLGYAMNDEE